MTDIPFSIKLMHSLGLVKVKQIEPKTERIVSTHTDGCFPKGFVYERPIKNRPNTISFKPQKILVLIPLAIMILIPVLILTYSNSPFTAPAQSSPANQISLEPSDGKYTDAQIIAKYPSLVDLDRALNSGELKLDQVSDNMRGMIKQQKLGEAHTP